MIFSLHLAAASFPILLLENQAHTFFTSAWYQFLQCYLSFQKDVLQIHMSQLLLLLSYYNWISSLFGSSSLDPHYTILVLFWKHNSPSFFNPSICKWCKPSCSTNLARKLEVWVGACKSCQDCWSGNLFACLRLNCSI